MERMLLILPFYLEIVSGYVCNHGSPSGERDTASPRGRSSSSHEGERLRLRM